MSTESWDSVVVSPGGIGSVGTAEQALSALPIAVCLADPSGHLAFANARAVARFGIDAVKFAGRSLHDVLGHLDEQGDRCFDSNCMIQQALRSGTTERLEREPFHTPDGSVVVFDWLSAPWSLPVPAGATVIMLRDVTTRAGREDQLTQHQQVMRRAQRLARLGVWEYDIVRDQVVWSPQLYELFGIPEGTHIDYATYMSGIHPDDRPVLAEYVRGALEQQRGYAVQHRVIRPDGEERVVLGIGEVVRDGQGRPLKLVGTAQDITERAQAEQRAFELAREKFSRERAETERERLKRVFEQLPAVITVTRGPDHVFEVTNARHRALVGRDVTGLSAREAFAAAEDAAFLERLDRVYSTGESIEAREVETTDASTLQTRNFNALYQPLIGADGAIEGVLSFAFDVTDVVHATRALDRALVTIADDRRRLEIINRELDQFAYVASHDLKAPLRGVANLAQWIEEDLQDSLREGTREMLALMRSRMHRMEALIDGLLQFSRAGRTRQKPERVDVGALVADVIELLSPPETTAIMVASDLPTLTTEKLALQQVFLNLISNAVKYTQRPDAQITVDVDENGDGDEYVFSVSDNGPGIPAEYHEKIWGIFQTLQPRDQIEGTGIGLALVKKIIESRGGVVWVTSAEGEGATFSFTWPKQTPASEE